VTAASANVAVSAVAVAAAVVAADSKNLPPDLQWTAKWHIDMLHYSLLVQLSMLATLEVFK